MSSSDSGKRRKTRRGSDRPRVLPASTEPFTRWVERPSRPAGIDVRGGANPLAAAEERAADLFRQAPAPAAFGSQARARVGLRLAAAPEIATARRARAGLVAASPGEWRRSPRRSRIAAWGIAAALLLFGGAVIAARGLDLWWVSLGPPRAAMTTVSDTSTNHLEQRQRRKWGSPAAPSVSQPASSPVPTLAPAPMAPSGLAREAQLLNVALERLRLRHDAAGALESLAQYRMTFPNGTLATEATTVRVDALLMLRREAEALNELAGLSLGASRREQELRTVRGELRAKSALARSERTPNGSTCRMASADFTQLLSEPTSSDLKQRALYGRAVCHARDGETRSAERDAARYLQQFPNGRFAPDLRRLAARVRVP